MEAKHIATVLVAEGLTSQEIDLKKILSTYQHITLTEEEVDEAMIWAKQRKEQKIKAQELNDREEQNRKQLTQRYWTSKQTDAWMKYRASSIFKTDFILDEYNTPVYNLLCLYFSYDPEFVPFAKDIGINSPSLDKGILLFGSFGVGKTMLMKLFSRNQRQVYHLHNAKKIADAYEQDGEEASEMFLRKPKNAYNDSSVFYHTHAGLCIDDLGTESEKKHFGNHKNVVGDLIEKRYAAGDVGIFLHATTNFKFSELDQFYGPRVSSRMFEIFNFIQLQGNDRRVP